MTGLATGAPEPFVAAAATPGHNGDIGLPCGGKACANGTVWKHHINNRNSATLHKILYAGIGLIGATGGIDYRDFPANFLGGSFCALDVAGVVCLIGRDRDDANQLGLLCGNNAGGQCQAYRQHA